MPYQIWSPKRRGFFSRSLVTFEKIKTDADLSIQYLLITSIGQSSNNKSANKKPIGEAAQYKRSPMGKETSFVSNQ